MLVEMIGEVVRHARGGAFVVACRQGAYRREVLARPARPMPQLVPGDRVTVEVSSYDPCNGRITRRGEGT